MLELLFWTKKCLSEHKLKKLSAEGQVWNNKQEGYAVGIGESVSLSCIAISKNAEPVCIMWSLNNYHLHLKGIACDKKTNVESATVFSQLEINFIDNNSFGNFTCSFQQYRYIGEKLYFHQKKATPVIESIETVITQYNINNYPGKEIYVYAPPGRSISIRKPTIFHSEVVDIIQYILLREWGSI